MEVEARACPLRQVQKTHGGCGCASVSAEYDAYRTRKTFEFVAVFGQRLAFFGQRFPFFLEDHQSLLCRLCFGIASERLERSFRFEP